ncbi:ribonuclease R [Candidatus Mycoplasma haematobovis]|uniref:Ribonuclease R n=1 Tax=Candidatus Mycoplasma haematobovis TaxID=432608 RepID=A0A1A9QE75_9MOLU|nr:ribonuclease R [Candidatus Mycoplasma haematobovis]
MGLSPEKAANLKKDIKNSILKVLLNDSRAMPLNILMHKVFQDIKPKYPSFYIDQKYFMAALDDLKKAYLVGKNNFNKYFIDYLDYEEKDVEGEGFLEVDPLTGNGYITVKKSFNERKKSSHFVHKKNLNNAKHGDYVRFVELAVTKKHFDKFSTIDARVKEVLPKPIIK